MVESVTAPLALGIIVGIIAVMAIARAVRRRRRAGTTDESARERLRKAS